MAVKLANRVKMTVSGTPGTGSITLNAAVAGFVTFAAGGVSDGDTVSYVIEDAGYAWEIGVGTYTASGTSLARTTVTASSAGGTTKISVTSAATVFIAPLAADFFPDAGYVRTAFTATQGQTTFTVSYTVGAIQVYLNGVLLNSADYTASNGTSVVLAAGADAGDILEVVALNVTGYVVAPSATYVRTSFTATGGQTTFSVVYTVGYVEVYFNGVLLNGSDYTATNGTSVVLNVAAVAGDIVETIAYNTVNLGTVNLAVGTSTISGGTTTRVLYDNAGVLGEYPITGSGSVVLSTSPTVTTGTYTGLNETKTAPSISGGTLTLNCAAGNVFAVALNANVTTLSFTNVPASGTSYGLTLSLTANGTAYTITWGAAVKWPGGTAPTLTSTNGKVDTFVLYTYDGGTTWYAFTAGQNA